MKYILIVSTIGVATAASSQTQLWNLDLTTTLFLHPILNRANLRQLS